MFGQLPEWPLDPFMPFDGVVELGVELCDELFDGVVVVGVEDEPPPVAA